MNKVELAAKVAEQFELSKRQAGMILDAVFGGIINVVKTGKEANMAGFGSFKLVQRKARSGVNPKTGERIHIPATQVPKFKPAKVFKETVK
ncbi:MAG: DNA-binding protein [Candidatus Brennerbacteria bacterium RIFOXYB1_FULL_41_13]|uniref:DNA-binding protein n=1 Tax=Candidatus Brennerbacteria bacterium RIFOXYD1_FULL_41_16 TaxID=1797529 RepID=A0A1G1XL12_9BACT|nr:MAG: DNA-binding protein HU [Parcubacteria group bacterium GW2011_GWB1_41_4]OGY39603.1 MAG: DNA-binding protein [Candidatus Brennerbacteria bacterium RIFOXYB1_FULL_41_13]OGY40719.1 MAG: DNA-binding protein [Candidatus Brennerbacteria bacterium RIFOXYD1_FULL_41_16]